MYFVFVCSSFILIYSSTNENKQTNTLIYFMWGTKTILMHNGNQQLEPLSLCKILNRITWLGIERIPGFPPWWKVWWCNLSSFKEGKKRIRPFFCQWVPRLRGRYCSLVCILYTVASWEGWRSDLCVVQNCGQTLLHLNPDVCGLWGFQLFLTIINFIS